MAHPPPVPRSWEWPLLGLLLGVLAVTQVVLTLGTHEMGVDGGYYLDVAMHVRDGQGLVSDVSLYHAGFPRFPYPSPIYPLWPLLLGWLGRLVDILLLAQWLPFALWLASLGAAFAFGRALLPGDLLPRLRGLHAGHLMALMLGTQREYGRHATMPYTEALAYLLLMIALWRATRAGPRLGRFLELGLWMALLCLCRSQMFIVPIAAALALVPLALWGGPQGRRWLLPGLVSLGVVGLALAGWWASVQDTVVEASPFTLLRFDQARASTVLAPIDVLRDDRGLGDLLLDRLSGLGVAWSITDWDDSYARGFFTQQWALPVALLVALPMLPRLGPARLRAFLARPDAFAWLLVVLIALGGLATVHLPHKEGFDTWYFHRRHAVICVLAFFLPLCFLLRHEQRLVRVAGLAVLLSTIGFSAESLYWRVGRALRPAPVDTDARMVDWLQGRVEEEGPVVAAVYAFKPPELAWRTEGVGYHWFYERTELVDLTAMFDELGAQYLLFPSYPTRKWRFRQDPVEFSRRFKASKTRLGDVLVYTRRKDAPEGEAAPSPPAPEP